MLPMKIASALLVMVLLIPLCQGCVGTRDISSQRPYSSLIGKKYILRQSCYVYRTRETGDRLFVGNASVGHFLPEEVTPHFIGRQTGGGVTIEGILPQGTMFTIVSCEEERHPEDIFRRLKATFQNASFGGQALDVSDLTDMSKEPPAFRETLAVPVEDGSAKIETPNPAPKPTPAAP